MFIKKYFNINMLAMIKGIHYSAGFSCPRKHYTHSFMASSGDPLNKRKSKISMIDHFFFLFKIIALISIEHALL